MSARFPWRCLLVLLVSLCSLYVLAQIPITATSPQADASNQPPQSTPPLVNSQSSPPLVNSNVKLGVGDLVEVGVFGVPELSQRARISNAGDLYLPLIDYVHVAGLTVDEAQDVIQKRLEDGGFVRQPHVSIYVNEAASQSVTVLGEVNRPGSYSVIGERRLFDVISAAGGLNDKAGRNLVIEHRDGQKVQLVLSINLADDDKSNVEILPGDTIIVSRAGIVYIVGDVNHPTGFRIEDNTLSVLKCLALAGGQTKTSALSKARILRESPNGVQEIPVDLKKVLYAKAPDMAMVKGDILFIPGSAFKTAAYRTADAAVSLATTVAVVGVSTF
jgi:polysaccharide biosynthesis/export protein